MYTLYFTLTFTTEAKTEAAAAADVEGALMRVLLLLAALAWLSCGPFTLAAS